MTCEGEISVTEFVAVMAPTLMIHTENMTEVVERVIAPFKLTEKLEIEDVDEMSDAVAEFSVLVPLRLMAVNDIDWWVMLFMVKDMSPLVAEMVVPLPRMMAALVTATCDAKSIDEKLTTALEEVVRM